MTKQQYEALGRIIGTMAYIYEDEPTDAVNGDIAIVREWMNASAHSLMHDVQ